MPFLVHEAQAAVGCIFPRKDLVLGRPLRCVPVCRAVPNLGEVYVFLFMYCSCSIPQRGTPKDGDTVMHLCIMLPRSEGGLMFECVLYLGKVKNLAFDLMLLLYCQW